MGKKVIKLTDVEIELDTETEVHNDRILEMVGSGFLDQVENCLGPKARATVKIVEGKKTYRNSLV